MSKKKTVLMAALVVLAMPAAVLADGITFGLGGGLIVTANISLVQPAATGGPIGSVATNVSSPARLAYVSRFSGNVVPGGGTVPASSGGNLPPQIAPTFGSMTTPNTFDFGSVVWTTGTASSFIVGGSSSSLIYNAGGTITITGNGSLPGTGAVLFSGTFTGPTTLTSADVPPLSPTCTTCNFWYVLSAPVRGTIDPGLMALLGLGNSSTGNGLLWSWLVGFHGLDDTVGTVEAGNLSVIASAAVPEPGTLALFGTGLIAVAGFVRRRFKA